MADMPVAKPSAIDTLRRVSLFADLTETEIQFLAQRAVSRQYAVNELVFSEGETCAGMYVVETGHVRIFKSSSEGREQILAIEGPGGSVAELPVFDGGNYPASCASADEAVVLFISKQDFHSLCLVHPQVALKVLKVVGRRLRTLVNIIEELSFTTVRSRLISLLLRLSREGNRGPDGVEIALPGSNQDLASHIGTVRELVSRNLSRLQAEGLIRMDGRKIVLLNPAALQQEVESSS
jgi:CRP-like cAMP-binding protein